MAKKSHKVVGLGGTFDHFHAGHEYLLDFAAQIGEMLLVGVTAEEMTLHKPLSQTIQSFHTRKQAVIKYCQRQGINVEVVEITDIYGPTISDKRITGLVITEETISGAQAINDLRETMHMRPLPTYVAKMVRDETGDVINATRIRRGEINRQGEVYRSVLSETITLTDDQRQYFKRLHGQIIDQPTPSKVASVVVGDTSLQQFLNEAWHFNLGIYDGVEQRSSSSLPFHSTAQPIAEIENPAGMITPELVAALQSHLTRKQTLLKVTGEEDLAIVAAMLIAPLHTHLYYGMPNQGLVELEVTETIKDAFYYHLQHDGTTET